MVNILTAEHIRSQQEPKISVAVCGPEKTGKTHFWCTFPGPIHVAYADPHMATVQGFIRDGKDITLWVCSTWRDFEMEFMPKVINRELECETVVVDSYSILSDKYVELLKGGSESLTIPQWGRVKSKHFDMLTQLVATTQPIPGQRSYNVVITSHLTDVTDDGDHLVKVRPAIQGSFKDVFGRCLDTVLFSKVESGKREVDKRTGLSTLLKPRFFLYTVPPDHYHSGGDSVGGKGGHKALPTTIENTYQALLSGWGIEEK